jgi:hypothetical protein
MEWRNLLSTCGTQQTLTRAHNALGLKTVYKLGKGGFDPTKPMTPQCDCSGFIAWAIGIPRELPPGSGKWLSTDEYWAGGRPVKTGLFTQIQLSNALVGDLLVYPDSGGNQGHISIINQVDNNMPSFIIHCSHGNYRNFGDAIRITTPAVFLSGNHITSVMRINYEMLRNMGT